MFRRDTWGKASLRRSHLTCLTERTLAGGGRRESVNKERNYEATQASGGMVGNLV